MPFELLLTDNASRHHVSPASSSCTRTACRTTGGHAGLLSNFLQQTSHSSAALYVKPRMQAFQHLSSLQPFETVGRTWTVGMRGSSQPSTTPLYTNQVSLRLDSTVCTNDSLQEHAARAKTEISKNPARLDLRLLRAACRNGWENSTESENNSSPCKASRNVEAANEDQPGLMSTAAAKLEGEVRLATHLA